MSEVINFVDYSSLIMDGNRNKDFQKILSAISDFIKVALHEEKSQQRKILGKMLEKSEALLKLDSTIDFSSLSGGTPIHSMFASFFTERAMAEMSDEFYSKEIQSLLSDDSEFFSFDKNSDEFLEILDSLPDYGALAKEVEEVVKADDELFENLSKNIELIAKEENKLLEMASQGDGKIGSWFIGLFVSCSLASVLCIVIAGLFLIIIGGVIVYRSTRRRRRRR